LIFNKEINKKNFEADVRAAIKELTSGTLPCDAIFFATDTLAIAGLKNLVQMKVKIPKDISVMSFDESEAFALFECPITYFRQPLEAIGIAAVDLLFEVMDKDGICKQVYLDSQLVVGKSCGE